ncbi:haloacid dehalogenase-like hydrolase [Bradyrhizobium acaciae]|uniref:haloacid dehalogenase-like hydrolase n=1 Tax=Bradyrhizobium acaciae TaxID=2683706 RepID=UPI001E30412C|nr:haloacid dehalogenase-like hydrolase [Bradyrhizobium acaciae]MCC8984848.1 haloacid dehalogenase-like hydrolase [Bradyrhizobium acaciae]
MTEPRLAGNSIARPHDTSSTDGLATLLGLPTSLALVLDLDGTLIKGDLLYLSLFSILRRNPLIVAACAAWLTHGRAALKRQLALRQRIDWSRIDLHQDVVALAEREKAAGRRVVLATAADALLANQLASRLPWIDQVLASDGEHNLKGANKADLLLKTFPAGFIYAGDSASDLAVWAHAAGIITVNARQAVRATAARLNRPTLHLPGRAAASKS